MKCKTALLFLLCLALALPALSFAWNGRVINVHDGDTITVIHDGVKTRVRLYGVDAPELKQYQGQNAKQFLSSQVMDKTVDVEPFDVDRYHRTVGVVRIGGVNVNEMLIRYGYAWVYGRYCKKSFCHEWEELQQEAQKNKKGIWATSGATAPWDFRKSNRR